MINEEIKQKAEADANKLYPDLEDMSCREHYVSGFIAGAHSRYKEIEELKRIINEQDGIICSLDCEDRVSIIKQRDKLKSENNQLRNPWISVEDQLPLPEKMVIGTDGWYYYPVCYNKHDERWRIQLGQIFGMDIPLSFITHYMPIHKI